MSTSNLITVPGLAQATVAINQSAYARRAEIIASAEFCPKAVTDAETQGEVTNVLREFARIFKEVEQGRQDAKAPALDIGRKIDAAAKEFLAALEPHRTRLNGLLVTYETEQRRIAMEAEAKRQAELKRQQEEAAAKQAEIDRKALEAEQARLAAEQKEREAATPEARAEAQDEARKATEAKTKADAAKAQQEEAAKLQQAELLRAPAPVVTRAAGASVQTPWTFEVVNIRELYTANPDLVELSVKRSDVLALIRSGTHAIPGLRIFQETRINVRS